MNHLKKDMKQIRKLFCLHSTGVKKRGLLQRLPNKFSYLISKDHQKCHQTKTKDNWFSLLIKPQKYTHNK